MAKKERERSTRRMPSGAQQYVRGDDSADRLETLVDAMRGEARRNDGRLSEAERRMSDGFLDEARQSSAARRTEVQGRRGYAEGGMVRGCKAGQTSGKGFSGSY